MKSAENLDHIRGVIIDMDGTIYIGEQLFPWTMKFLASLEKAGIRRLFLTNNSAKSTAEYASKLRRLGINLKDSEILTAGWATMHYIKSETSYQRIYLVGTPGLRKELEEGGLTVVNGDCAEYEGEKPDAVVLGFDMSITYARIRKAAELIQQGIPYIATHPDQICPTESGNLPDCGSMIELLVPATGRRPLIIGKPNTRMVDAALSRLSTSASQTAVIGDLLPTDMKMAEENGLTGILVMSGETSREDLENSTVIPDLVFENTGELADMLQIRNSEPSS
ncbi:MAG: HAD-IIA family hydrolase [Paracoccaceae bacterium]|jgi:HAD superfamily hydrolase (TIGR01457 family)|nr:HAD-IIA family hydrolase [Paracoccaceae bacterium]|tara:strand:- start:830 stop:1669 length:840 start_codon:yes stop_codon:yes gene_type:complete